MEQEEHILKERLRSLIAGRKVHAALFYTFNFDPKFFENYVMPLLVPEHTFINNSIANNILWRRLYKDNVVPPITVYFDQDAKSPENGPFLDYYLVPVSMPMIGKNKGNFHPKQSFIVVGNDIRSAELIVITGSNNLTQSGWCENIECVSEHTLINGSEFPDQFKKNLRAFIGDTMQAFGKEQTLAEECVLNYLNKAGKTKERECYFYDSYKSSFQQFLDGQVLWDDSIKTLEIISPYFKSTPGLLQVCKERNIKVKIQVPFKGGYCLLEESVFESYKAAGIRWYYPDDDTRSTHSKVYRFYGSENVYTIVGSVNLTEPAWTGYSERPKQIYNIESAVLYVEKADRPFRLFKKEIKEDRIRFLPLSNSLENCFERFEIPIIDFTINWFTKTLSWKSKAKNECNLHLSASEIFLLKGTNTIILTGLKNGQAIIDAIARKLILTVVEKINGAEKVHLYYLNQIGFENRPLEFRFSANDVIDAWELLGIENVELNDWLLNRLELATDLLQDESGRLLSDNSGGKSLLNEMARHFYGLVKLEEFLFDEAIFKKSNGCKVAHFNNLRYYLTCDNVDTLFSYLSDMRKLHSGGSILTVYYWLILNIVLVNFYTNRRLAKAIKWLPADNVAKNEMKKTLNMIIEGVRHEISLTEKNIDLNKKQMKWALSILQTDYAIS